MENKRTIYTNFIVFAIVIWFFAGAINFVFSGDTTEGLIKILIPPVHIILTLLFAYSIILLFVNKYVKEIEAGNTKNEIIRKNEDIINFALKGAGLCMWDWNFDQDVLKYDRQFVEELGLDIKFSYLNYNMWLNMIYPEDRRHVARELEKHLKGKSPAFKTECRMNIGYDRTIWVAIRGKVIERNERGKPVRAIGVISDVSQRRLAILRLKGSEDRLKAVFNNVSVGIMLVDRFGNITQVNEQFANLMGYTPLQMMKLTLTDITHPDDIDISKEKIKDIYDDKIDSYNLIKRYKKKNGTYIWGDLSVTTIKRMDGVVESLVGIIVDITEQKLAEEKLRINEERLKLSLESANEGIWDLNLKSNKLYISPRYYTMLGYDPFEFPPTFSNIKKLVHPDDQEKFPGKFNNINQNSDFVEEYFESEIRLKTKAGIWKWVLNKGKIIEWTENGEPLRIVGTNIDITNLKGIEEALRKSESRLRLVIQNMPVMMNATDSKNNYLVWNRECEIVTGYTANEITQNPNAFKILYPDDEYRNNLLKKFKEKKNNFRDEEVHLRCKDGSTKIILWSNISALFPIPAWSSWSVGIDITDRKMAEQKISFERALLAERVAERTSELQLLNKDLERALKAKDEFLSTMSHELRTPLNAILGFSEALQEFTFGDLNDRQLKALKTIEESGRHLLSLINDILDFSKMETDKLMLNLDEVSIDIICQSSLSFVKEMALNKNIHIKWILEQSVTYIYADQMRIKQIIVNLLTNAIKFTPESGDVKLTVSKDEENEKIIIEVEDTGIGIEKDKIEEIFKPFVQLDSSFSKRHYGTGLGLALVKKITEKHKGIIKVESEKDKGSKFSIILPQDEAAKTKLKIENTRKDFNQQETEIGDGILNGKNKLILIAEDDLESVKPLNSYLENKGFRTIIAKNGIEAVKFAISQKPDIILMDIMMPKMSGLEAIKLLRNKHGMKKIPIIVTTALSGDEDKKMSIDAGADIMLTKPLDLNKLSGAIISQLKNYESNKSNE